MLQVGEIAMKRQQAGVALADAIEKEIRKDRHLPGAVLAFENELQSRHQVGRSVVRQAVRILEQRGIAYMRRGNGGGLIVTEPKPQAAIRVLSIVLESQLADFADLATLVKVTDEHLYLDCAARVDEEECERLRALVKRLQRLSDENLSFTHTTCCPTWKLMVRLAVLRRRTVFLQ